MNKRKVRVEILARKVVMRMFIVTALIVCGILLALFLAPGIFEFDDSSSRFGDKE